LCVIAVIFYLILLIYYFKIVLFKGDIFFIIIFFLLRSPPCISIACRFFIMTKRNFTSGDLDLWPWKSIGFQTLLRTKYVPSLVKIHWKMLILECSQGCYAVTIWPLDLWPWKSIGFQTLIRTMYVPSLVKIHWRMFLASLWTLESRFFKGFWPNLVHT
jgi:hypothetical protein